MVQAPSAVKSMQRCFNKTKTCVLLFSKCAFYNVCQGTKEKKKKKVSFFRGCFHLNSFSLPCCRGAEIATDCLFVSCQSALPCSLCVEVSFPQMVIWGCGHTALTTPAAWLHSLADPSLSLQLRGHFPTEGTCFLPCHCKECCNLNDTIDHHQGWL